MIAKKYYGLVMNFWLSLFNGITVSISMIYVNTGAFIPMAILISSLQALVIGFITGIIVPAAPFGAKIAGEKLHFKPGSLKYVLISTLPICIAMVIVLTFSFALINVGFGSAFAAAWLGSIPLALVVSYITSVVLTPLAGKLSDLMTRAD